MDSLAGDVPARYRRVDLSALAPSPSALLNMDRQGTIISAIKARPDDSYLFVGAPGTGKTHLMLALYRRALAESVDQQIEREDLCQSVWRVNASALLAQHSAWAVERNRDEPNEALMPSVTVEVIAAAVKKGYRPCLFLDELDKVAPTVAKLSSLCSLVDAVYVEGGQVVATSNKSSEYLAGKWGSDEAGTILRRIGADGGHIVNFTA